MNTRAILFVLGVAIGAIAVFLWKKHEIDEGKTANKRLQDCTHDLGTCSEQLKEARAEAALSVASAVYIGPAAGTLSKEPLILKVDKAPVVYWKPRQIGQGHTVGIKFLAKDYPTAANNEPPFVGGQKGADQNIRCDGETCFSYDLNKNIVDLFTSGAELPCGPEVPPPPPGTPPYKQCLVYKYWQTLDKTTVDGHIIIVKP